VAAIYAAPGAPYNGEPWWDTRCSVSRENVEVVRKGYEAWNSGDRQWVLDHLDPGVEWTSAAEDPEATTYSGREGVERFWDEWRAAMGHMRFEPEELIDAGDHVVVVACRVGRGEHSGAEVSDRIVQVFSSGADGRCVRVGEFSSKEAALNSIGHPARQ
jgi:uncharacterized protein